jgi:hypothetical protein
MARSRLQLHSLLTGLTEHVYFQPPPNDQMQYPVHLVFTGWTSADHANNELYRHAKQYQVTVVDRDPDSILPDQVEALPLCAFVRAFPADDLNHWVFDLYF